MAGRATYTETDKAKVYVVLRANDGNVKRTARETGIPENTVRRWRDEFIDRPPQHELVQVAAGDFVDDASRVRNLALRRIEVLIPDSTKISELNVTVGVLTDKIDRANGIGQTVSHEHHLPPADEIREVMQGFVQAAQEMSRAREHEIVDAEVLALPAVPK
jgi:transposase-like protein